MGESRVVMREDAGAPFLLRVAYFILVGWWLTGIWINIAWLLNVTIIGLPLGLWMINRVPQVLTLKPMRSLAVAEVRDGEVVRWRIQGVPQHFWLWRLIYFVLIGWWLSLIWANVAWFFCATIIGLPIGILMFNALPGVTTLMRT